MLNLSKQIKNKNKNKIIITKNVINSSFLYICIFLIFITVIHIICNFIFIKSDYLHISSFFIIFFSCLCCTIYFYIIELNKLNNFFNYNKKHINLVEKQETLLHFLYNFDDFFP